MRLLASAAAAVLALAAAVPAQARDLPSTLRSPLSAQGVCSGFYRDDFNYNNVVNAYNWNGDPNSAGWVDEFGSDAFVANGFLEMDLRRHGNPRGKESAVTWTRWWQFGEICTGVRIGRGGGVVSAIFIASYVPGQDIDDEIDFEWVGRNVFEVQTNYFSQGYAIYGVNGQYHGHGDAFNEVQTVCVERTSDYIAWKINGNTVRMLYRGDMGSRFPDRPAKIVFDLWDAGVGTPPGTVAWSGGPTDWSNEYNPDYRMQVDWITINCAGGSAPPPPPPPPPPSGGGGSSGGSGSCTASTFDQCSTGCCIGGSCQPCASCYGAGSPQCSGAPPPPPPSGGGSGGSCSASTFDQCPSSGCCIGGTCAPCASCFGPGAPQCSGSSGGGSGSSGTGGSCTASTVDQCPTGCCIGGACAPCEQCFGPGAPQCAGAPAPGGTGGGCTASTFDQCPESGCCFQGSCAARSVCFG
ncbi:concanavalin A-like lectin/glucanase domain-containing protein [Hyaloraphidium curvatum]|nr:concanavalin A-like lectin/glucanase domain-containing protein [Hyaloraphidium curvatum]